MTTAPMPAGTVPTPESPPSEPPTSGTTSPLARLVGDVDSFMARHLGVGPLLWRGGDFGDLLSLTDVDDQLTRRAVRRPVVRLVRDGEPLDPSTWTTRVRTGNTWIDDVVDPARALGLFAEGATIVLQSLQRWWPPLTTFCDGLAAALGHPVQANAYLSPEGAAGLAPHHDTHDVFVVQLHGTKRWVVRQPLLEAPLRSQRSDRVQAARQPVLLEVDLAPGDCLYLPRGFVHSAVAQEGVSLHATVGVLAATALDVVRGLVDRAADEPAFRRMLPVGYGRDEGVAAGVVDDVVLELITWLEGLDREAVARDLVARAERQRPARLHGHLLDLVDLIGIDGRDGIDDTTVVAARAGVVAERRDDGHNIRVVLRDRNVVLPAVLGATVRRLLDGAPHAVGELADRLDEPSRRVLVRRLVREGVLRIVRDGCHP